MARRSPQNDRYKKDANIGSTRKSAASAKPKRPQAESGTSGTPAKAERSRTKAKAKPARILLPNPDTEEFKRWNMINYALLGMALLFALVVLAVGPQLQKTPWYFVLWAGWGASLAGSMYIQIVKLRKLRQEWVDSGQAAAKAKADDKERAEKAAAKEAAKAAKNDEKDD
jgi:uncharacterized membrane protein YcjF (UPF0283 family)